MLFIRIYLCKTEEVMDTRALPRLSFVFRVSKCSTEAVLAGQFYVQKKGKCKWPYLCVIPRTRFFVLLWVCGICQASCALSVHVFGYMFALRKPEDQPGLEGRPENFDLNIYFPILVMSEGAPSETWQSLFSCLFTGNTFTHHEARNQVRRW